MAYVLRKNPALLPITLNELLERVNCPLYDCFTWKGGRRKRVGVLNHMAGQGSAHASDRREMECAVGKEEVVVMLRSVWHARSQLLGHRRLENELFLRLSFSDFPCLSHAIKRGVSGGIGVYAYYRSLLSFLNDLTDQQGLYAPLTRHLRDAHHESGWGMGFTFTRFPRFGLPMWRIDYVFHSPDLVALSTAVEDYGGSDHRPVIVRLAFR